MSYDSRLYIVEKQSRHLNFRGQSKTLHGEMVNGKEMFFAPLIACFELESVPEVSSKMNKYPEADDFCYADDGNTEIIEDHYGEPLHAVPLKDAISIIEEAAKQDDYRRFTPCLALLKALEIEKDRYKEVIVLHFGH